MSAKPVRGFTLIELMVTISIVAILAAIGITVYSSAQATARDSLRRQTLQEIAAALEVYKTANGSYPLANATPPWYSSEPGDAYSNNSGNWIPGLAPNFIKQLPHDPQGGAANTALFSGCAGHKKSYLYQSNGQEYALLSGCSMENSKWDTTDPLYDYQRPTWGWKVCQGTTGCSW